MTKLAALAMLLAAAGCASAPPPAAPAPIADPSPPPRRSAGGPSAMRSEIGGMSEEAMDKAFASLGEPLQGCIDRGASRVRAFGGHFTLALRIEPSGSAKWAYLRESTLGDRDTEKCVLDLAREKRWPRPVGGDGLAQKSFDIEAPTAPAELDERGVRPAAERARADTAKCRRGIAGSFMATAYVRDGRVLAAGVAPPNEQGEDAADCIVDVVRRLRFEFAGGREAKVSFEIR